MAAQLIKIESVAHQAEEIRKAAAALREGAVVIFPTETVYGVAVSAANSASVDRLRRVKGRPDDQPFTVHIGHRGDWQAFVPSAPPIAHRFIKKAWPGPLTLIFPVQ